MNDHDVAACGHSNHWTDGSGKCLACERDALRLRVAELEADNVRLCTAAKETVDYFDMPIWPYLPHTGEYIRALREAIGTVVKL